MNTEQTLQTAAELLTAWNGETTHPESNRMDVLIGVENLRPAVTALHDAHWGYLSAITGLDLGVEVSLADEASVSRLFSECAPGVVPGLPNAWGVEMVWDDDLMAQPDVYLEAGDHERLLHIETRFLREAFGDAPHCHFSQPRMQHIH